MPLEGWFRLRAVAGWRPPIEQLESLAQMATGRPRQPSAAPQESVDSPVSAGCGLSLLYKAREAIGSHSYCPLWNQTLSGRTQPQHFLFCFCGEDVGRGREATPKSDVLSRTEGCDLSAYEA